MTSVDWTFEPEFSAQTRYDRKEHKFMKTAPCPWCGEIRTVRSDGTMVLHSQNPRSVIRQTCPGSRAIPV